MVLDSVDTDIFDGCGVSFSNGVTVCRFVKAVYVKQSVILQGNLQNE